MRINLSRLVVEHRALRREAIMLRLPYPVSINMLFVNVPGKGRVMSAAYRTWKAEAENTIVMAGRPRLNGPVELAMAFEEKPGRHDLDNLAKGICDLLVSMRVIDADDSKIVRKLTLQWGEERGAIVEIRPAPGDWITRRGAAAKAA